MFLNYRTMKENARMRENCLGGTACTGEQLDYFKQFSLQVCSFEFLLKHMI